MVRSPESVSEMLGRATGDKGLQRELEERVGRRKIAKMLFRLRSSAELTEEQLGRKLGISGEEVSRIEHTDTDNLSVGVFVRYVRAAGFDVAMLFHPQKITAVEWVKWHFMECNRKLSALAELAQGEERDSQILSGIRHFLGEAIFNFLDMLSDSAKRLPSGRSKRDKDLLEIIMAGDVDDDDKESEVDGVETRSRRVLPERTLVS